MGHTGARFIKICIEKINHLAKAHRIAPGATNFTATPSAPPDTHKGHTAQNRANAGLHQSPPIKQPINSTTSASTAAGTLQASAALCAFMSRFFA